MSEDLETFGPYTILEDLAQGGMGIVQIARRYGSSDPCVLKKPLARFSEDFDLLQRFRREANLCAQLAHPNIARLQDAGTIDDTFYISFELIDGQPLSRLLRRLSGAGEWLSFSAIAFVVTEVLEGLACAHEASDPNGAPLGIVHRDLSPTNMMIGYDARVAIIDFGVAVGAVDEHRTMPGRSIGTVRYMSPEQARGETVDPRSDIYTMGVVLWELLARRRLVPKTDPQAMLGYIVNIPTPVLEGVPEGLRAVVDRAHAKDAKDRYASAREMSVALKASIAVEPEAAREELRALMRRFHGPEEAHLLKIRERARSLAFSDTLDGAQLLETGVHGALSVDTVIAPATVVEPTLADDKTATDLFAELEPEVEDDDPDTTARLPAQSPDLPDTIATPRRTRRSSSRKRLERTALVACALGALALLLVISAFRQKNETPPTPSTKPPPARRTSPSVTAAPRRVDEPPPPPVTPPKTRKASPKRALRKAPKPALAPKSAPPPRQTLERKLAALERGGFDRTLLADVCDTLKRRIARANDDVRTKATAPLQLGCSGLRPAENLRIVVRLLADQSRTIPSE